MRCSKKQCRYVKFKGTLNGTKVINMYSSFNTEYRLVDILMIIDLEMKDIVWFVTYMTLKTNTTLFVYVLVFQISENNTLIRNIKYHQFINTCNC